MAEMNYPPTLVGGICSSWCLLRRLQLNNPPTAVGGISERLLHKAGPPTSHSDRTTRVCVRARRRDALVREGRGPRAGSERIVYRRHGVSGPCTSLPPA